ncbi:MAG: hypothetical protein WC544_05160, partial [Patescibacteria group bacterium]
MHGQFKTQIYISGLPDTMVQRVYLRAYQGNEASSQQLGTVPCQMSQANLNNWSGWCDTMTFLNSTNIFLQPHAIDYSGNELYLRGSTGSNILSADLNPKFGPFSFINTYYFINPQSNTTIAGSLSFHAGLSGDASSARIEILPTGSQTVIRNIPLIKQSGSSSEDMHLSTEWFSTQWDSAQLPNSGYTAHLTFDSLYDTTVVRSRVAQTQFIILNSSVTECNTSDAWTCTDWTVCSSSGTQVRTCTLSPDCPSTIPSPSLTQTCTPVITNTNTAVIPANSNTNTATNTNTSTTPPPLTQIVAAPTITDPVNNSQHRNTLFAVRGAATPGIRVQIVVDASRVDGIVTAGSDGQYQYLIQTPLSPGTHHVMAIAVNSNNISSQPSNIVTLSMLAPEIIMKTPSSGQTVFGRSQRLLSTV